MKKLKLAWAALAFTAVITSSCNDDLENTSLTLDNFQEANLKAYVYAELDITKPGLEIVPSGTKVAVTAPYSDFNAEASGVWADTLFTDANGMVETALKVASNGTNYTINPIDFESTQIQAVTASQSVVGKIYESSTQTIKLLPLSEEILQFNYADRNYNNYVDLINIDLYLNGEFNEAQAGNEYIPSGEPITVQSISGKWSTVINTFETTTVEGVNYSKATVTVKKGEELKIVKFDYNRTLADNSQKSYVYYKTLSSYDTHGESYKYTLDSDENLPN